MAYPGLILANAARMMGIEAMVFFTFWGLDIVTEKKVELIETIRLFIAGSGPHRARVMWRDGQDVGVHFERPLTPALLEQIHAGKVETPAQDAMAGTGQGFGRRTGLGPLRPV